MFRVVIVLLTFMAQYSLLADEPKVLVRTAVNYDNGMVVCVTEGGVAAIRFRDSLSIGNDTGNGIVGVEYDWRFLASMNPGGDETLGSGKVFVKLSDGKPTKESSEIQCDQVTLSWQHGNSESGHVLFDPQVQALYPLADSAFEDDLDDWLRPSLRTVLPGKRGNHPGPNIAAAVVYEDTTIFVETATGVAVLGFEDVFDREVDNNQTLHGVKYTSSFVPVAGDETLNQGELYEAYTAKKYDGPKSSLTIISGPTEIEWSRGGPNNGWLYYEPSQMRIWMCPRSESQVLRMAILKRLSESSESDASQPETIEQNTK